MTSVRAMTSMRAMTRVRACGHALDVRPCMWHWRRRSQASALLACKNAHASNAHAPIRRRLTPSISQSINAANLPDYPDASHWLADPSGILNLRIGFATTL